MLRLPLQVSFLSREIGNVRLRNFVQVVATRRNIEETDFLRNTGTGNNFASCHSSKGMTKQQQQHSAAYCPLDSSCCWMEFNWCFYFSNFRYQGGIPSLTVVNSLNFSTYFLIIYSVYIGTSSHLVYRYCFRILY